MSIEFEIWPTGVVERLQRVEEALRRQGLSARAVRAVLLELLEIYEDFGEDHESLVAMVVPDQEFQAEAVSPPLQAPEDVQATIPKHSAYVESRLRRASGDSLTPCRATDVQAPRSGGQIARNLPRLKAGLVDLGYEPSRRNSAVFQHPSRFDRRIVVKHRVVRLERKDSPVRPYVAARMVTGRRPWQLWRSFQISNQVDEALARAGEFCRAP